MKEEALKSQALTEFLRAGDNYGRWAFFPNSNGKGGNLAVMKTDVDGRFSVLVGGRAFGSEAQDAVRAASAFLYNRNLEPLGLYDAHTHEVYASVDLTSNFLSARDVFGAEQSLRDVQAPLFAAVHERVTEYMNDPANRDSLADAARSSERWDEPHIDSTRLNRMYVQSKSLGELRSELPMWEEAERLDSRPALASVIDYLSDPQGAVDRLFHRAVQDPDVRRILGRKILYHEAEIAAYAEFLDNAGADPEQSAKKAVSQALSEAFGDARPANLWITVARDGQTARFQYPMERLTREMEGSWPFWIDGIPSTGQRKEVMDAFGVSSHGSTHVYDPKLACADIADISYRGKSVYAMESSELSRRTAAREVPFALYKAQDNLRERMFDKSVRQGWTRPAVIKFADGFQSEDAAPEDFAQTLTGTVTVGAHATEETAFAQAYRQIGRMAGEQNQGMAVGDAISLDGKTRLVGMYDHFDELPFSLPTRETKKDAARDDVSISLTAEARDMTAASSELGSANSYRTTQKEER